MEPWRSGKRPDTGWTAASHEALIQGPHDQLSRLERSGENEDTIMNILPSKDIGDNSSPAALVGLQGFGGLTRRSSPTAPWPAGVMRGHGMVSAACDLRCPKLQHFWPDPATWPRDEDPNQDHHLPGGRVGAVPLVLADWLTPGTGQSAPGTAAHDASNAPPASQQSAPRKQLQHQHQQQQQRHHQQQQQQQQQRPQYQQQQQQRQHQQRQQHQQQQVTGNDAGTTSAARANAGVGHPDQPPGRALLEEPGTAGRTPSGPRRPLGVAEGAADLLPTTPADCLHGDGGPSSSAAMTCGARAERPLSLNQASSAGTGSHVLHRGRQWDGELSAADAARALGLSALGLKQRWRRKEGAVTQAARPLLPLQSPPAALLRPFAAPSPPLTPTPPGAQPAPPAQSPAAGVVGSAGIADAARGVVKHSGPRTCL